MVPGFWSALISVSAVGSAAGSFGGCEDPWPDRTRVTFAVFDTRLLNAGQPPQPDAPPVPLHFPPPGHEPPEV